MTLKLLSKFICSPGNEGGKIGFLLILYKTGAHPVFESMAACCDQFTITRGVGKAD